MISVIDVLMLMCAFGSFIVALISLVVWITTNIQKNNHL
ncbi:putative holin-like toxin [Staphylococcus delphini]|uniref:Holin-like toxin n=1 Tax=Staphylococcus delphini TaxID=53344 RepID=A0AAQ0D611_9STAP|nr:putative holin-like toxin [Staphylococcus delphini]MDE9753213.1 putative holin-like toxin [Staphylococcus delphini]MDE9790825.1 putative holin-like toxin [Staphylococcus delphini]MDE9794180.1 putative holin-like toxin [Staphylococcus delphini]MDE9797678.1 putative holin-like toxin [Staphylococcus delphini]QUM66412.1 putative holin-like toxin [Staphylococcus delphini]